MRVYLWISILVRKFSVDNSVENIVTRNKYFSLVFFVKKIINNKIILLIDINQYVICLDSTIVD